MLVFKRKQQQLLQPTNGPSGQSVNLRLLLEYDGAGFHGWQIQPGVRTIESELKRAIELVLRRPVGTLIAAGRTDSGVHARGQVVNVHIPLMTGETSIDSQKLGYSVSRILLGEVSVLRAELVGLEFNARRDAISKQYSYLLSVREAPPTLLRGRAWHIGPRCDLQRMKEEAHALVGRHDFTSMRGAGCNAKSPVREIFEVMIEEQQEPVRIKFIGEGFLKHMVRNMVGTLVGLSKPRPLPGTMREILRKCDRRAGGVTAPGYGLTLDWVKYHPELAESL